MTTTSHVLRATTIPEAWYKGLSHIINTGDILTDERESRIKEQLNLQITITKPFENPLPSQFPWTREQLDTYAHQLISGEGSEGFKYTYGQRLRNWNRQVDQLEYILHKITTNPNTRRATATTWMPYVDTRQEEVPCMVLLDFKKRRDQLHLTCVFRSHDFASAYPANLYGLTKLLEYTAKRTNTTPGEITTLSISAHIYEHDWTWVKEILNNKTKTERRLKG
jgi:thymidylate synthase